MRVWRMHKHYTLFRGVQVAALILLRAKSIY